MVEGGKQINPTKLGIYLIDGHNDYFTPLKALHSFQQLIFNSKVALTAALELRENP